MAFKKSAIFIIVVWGMFSFTTACGPAAAPAQGSEPGTEHHMDAMQTNEEHALEHDMDGMEPGGTGRVPNNGAEVRIVAPAAGADIQHGSDVVVEIETDNFDLGTDGNHWHIFVDGQSRGMITGVDYDEVIRGLEPGVHQLGAYLSNGAHEELAEGAMITITVVR